MSQYDRMPTWALADTLAKTKERQAKYQQQGGEDGHWGAETCRQEAESLERELTERHKAPWRP